MIHRVEVTRDSEPAEIKKLFRKKLMTGGAVIALHAELNDQDKKQLFLRFSSGAVAHGVQALVLSKLIESMEPDAWLEAEVQALGINELSLQLQQQSSTTL